MRIEIKDVMPNGLIQERWVFNVIDNHSRLQLRLAAWAYETRPTKRHKFRAEQHYDQHERRGFEQTKREDVHIPEDVLDRAKERILDDIEVV